MTVSDKRFDLIRHVNLPYDVSYMATRFEIPEDWRRRAAALREQVLGSAGLLPMPERNPLNTEVFGRIDRSGYTVEKVRFESRPGFYVTGNLYRPKGQGPFPAVLNPHGHWPEGRLCNNESCTVPGRCINFALQGYVAFSYDVVGWNDSRQLPHNFSGPRERLWGISPGGVQLWNSIRAIDFLETLPDVDRARIACTGASGGGTQTFLLCAVEDRIKVAAPVNMISAHMQGGCACENPPNLRIDTDNIEIAALMAPRPMIMVSATGDWTKDTLTVEHPAVRAIYELLGAGDRVTAMQVDCGHNYNRESREAVYSWFGRWLPEKPLAQPVREQPFEVEADADLLIHPRDDFRNPNPGVDPEPVFKSIIHASEARLTARTPSDPESLQRFKQAYEPALRRALSISPLIEPASLTMRPDAPHTVITSDEHPRTVIPSDSEESAFPVFRELVPETGCCAREHNGTALVVHELGSRHLLNATESVVTELLGRNRRVLLIDAFATGDHIAPDDAPPRNPKIEFFDTYNRTDTAERVHDILAALKHLESDPNVGEVDLVGLGKAGLWCILARPFASNVRLLAADAAGFDSSSDESFLGDMYVPCLRRAGDFRAAMALCAPAELFVHNTQGKFDMSLAERAYAAAGVSGSLCVSETPAAAASIADWLSEG